MKAYRKAYRMAYMKASKGISPVSKIPVNAIKTYSGGEFVLTTTGEYITTYN